MDSKKFLVITPTYNEAENIEQFITSVLKKDVSLLIVDDNSPDGTGDVIKKIKKEISDVYSIHRSAKKGLGSAYKEGFQCIKINQLKRFFYFYYCI